MIWFSFPLDFVSQEVQDFKIVTVMVFRILLFFLRFGFFWFFCDLDLLVFRISCHRLTVQILKGFESLHNLFDKGVGFFDFWKFSPVALSSPVRVYKWKPLFRFKMNSLLICKRARLIIFGKTFRGSLGLAANKKTASQSGFKIFISRTVVRWVKFRFSLR